MTNKSFDIKAAYPYSAWEIREEAFTPAYNARNETVFSLGNGYIGFRGNFEEGYDDPQYSGVEGTYLNGFYETDTIQYGEIAYGYPEKSQTMLNVASAKMIGLYVDGEAFSMSCGVIRDYSRVLLLREGILKRSLIWQSASGKQVRIETERMVSLTRKHIAAIRYEVTPLNFSGEIKLVSGIDGDVSNQLCSNDPRVGSGIRHAALSVTDAFVDADTGYLVQKTRNSGLALACCMIYHLISDSYSYLPVRDMLSVRGEYCFRANENEKTVLYKYISYTDTNDFSEYEILERAKREAHQAWADGYEKLKEEQKAFLADFWYRSDIEIDGDPALQQGIRFNMFHLLQSAGHDGKRNIGAKGLTGEGYEGHYFWDTEMYIMPFFLYSNPQKARGLLEYRYNTLDKARKRARQLGHSKGALYPWRTINGEECSANYPSGTAQYHIDAGIAYAVKRYMDAARDEAFLIRYGAEIIFETARLWADLGAYIPSKGNKFCINGVTGPDEYNAVVNNNCYTNLMAQMNLRYACTVVEWMREDHPEEYRALANRITLADDEPREWTRAADNMVIPYDQTLEIHLQDDAFLDRAPWDFANTPADKYPLLLHYHPLVIYRHQVCKQADLVLALLLLGEKFTLEQKKRDFSFYEKCTTHDSSLSASVFSIVACETGYYEKAYRYFADTARTDLDDIHGNTRDGIHAAGMAGAWMCIVQGFAGMRYGEGGLSLNPYLPPEWEGYRFKIAYRGCLISVSIDRKQIRYALLSGDNIEISHGQETIVLNQTQNIACRPCALLNLQDEKDGER